MTTPFPKQLDQVSVQLKANIYFDGKVVSHTLLEKDGSKKTIGLIYPGVYSFNTGAPECMMITAGTCKIKLKGENKWESYAADQAIEVPGNSSFEISVENGIAEYLCLFR
ncbi:MAG TPA: hypothetical protein DDW49_06145 [Deltaproteobacteria bacterium]|nr:MAG: hypothetical protein A2048_02135 [Deltaproteobacteria bacterium GWA2_45_12]HBF12954.1 hypothetical protein [Deltaproteobacteria bacterium]